MDKTILDILTKIDNKIKVIIICDKETTYLKDIDINKFNEEFNNLNVKYSKHFHDRFIILDGNKVYHIGASIKDAGKKCFAISMMEDPGIVSDLLNRLTMV